MKNKLLVVGLVFFGLLACRKRTPVELPSDTYGTMENLLVNGKSWARPNMVLKLGGGIKRNCPNRDTYSIYLTNESQVNDSLTENMYIDNLKIGQTGKINISSRSNGQSCDTVPYAAFLLIVGKDFIEGGYRPDPRKDNYLQIDTYNPDKREIAGKFNITFLNESFPNPFTDRLYGDTVIFNDVRFKMRIW